MYQKSSSKLQNNQLPQFALLMQQVWNLIRLILPQKARISDGCIHSGYPITRD